MWKNKTAISNIAGLAVIELVDICENGRTVAIVG